MSNKLTETEITRFRLNLIGVMEKYIENQTAKDNSIGYIPDEAAELMADAALNVLLTINATNHYFKDQGILNE